MTVDGIVSPLAQVLPFRNRVGPHWHVHLSVLACSMQDADGPLLMLRRRALCRAAYFAGAGAARAAALSVA